MDDHPIDFLYHYFISHSADYDIDWFQIELEWKMANIGQARLWQTYYYIEITT